MVRKQKITKIPSQRGSPRKTVAALEVSYISSLENLAKIAKNCEIIEASSTGLLVLMQRSNLIPQALRGNLNLDMLVGQHLSLKIDAMNLEISGKVVRTKFLGKTGFHIALDYTDDAPEYWRECLMDLLPIPGEID